MALSIYLIVVSAAQFSLSIERCSVAVKTTVSVDRDASLLYIFNQQPQSRTRTDCMSHSLSAPLTCSTADSSHVSSCHDATATARSRWVYRLTVSHRNKLTERTSLYSRPVATIIYIYLYLSLYIYILAFPFLPFPVLPFLLLSFPLTLSLLIQLAGLGERCSSPSGSQQSSADKKKHLWRIFST